MKEKQIAVSAGMASTLLLAACAPGGGSMVDTRPIGHGIEFLGMCLVLAAIIAVFGRFIGR